MLIKYARNNNDRIYFFSQTTIPLFSSRCVALLYKKYSIEQTNYFINSIKK